MITAEIVLFLFSGFVCGYLIGRVDLFISSTNVRVKKRKKQITQSAGVFTKNTARRENPAVRKVAPVDDIDTRVYVTPVATSTLTKTTDAKIGKTSTTEDNINQSVSKLAQLKGQ